MGLLQIPPASMSNYEYRFGGIGRLYGVSALEQLRKAHVCVIGIGGVGSWAVEALARSGVGQLTLVDLDDVCLSNARRLLGIWTIPDGDPASATQRIPDFVPTSVRIATRV